MKHVVLVSAVILFVLASAQMPSTLGPTNRGVGQHVGGPLPEVERAIDTRLENGVDVTLVDVRRSGDTIHVKWSYANRTPQPKELADPRPMQLVDPATKTFFAATAAPRVTGVVKLAPHESRTLTAKFVVPRKMDMLDVVIPGVERFDNVHVR